MSAIETVETSGRPIIKWGLPGLFRKLLVPKRHKVIYGGRGGGKTRNLATIVAGLCYMRPPIQGMPFRVLCGREYQNSIAESVHYEIVAAIQRLGLGPYFKITASSVICLTTGAHVFYRGMHNNIDSIKSIGDIDLFWGDEAHSFTTDTLVRLGPTIRRDPPFGPFGQGSELWFTLNQTNDDDPIYVKFNCNVGAWEDDQNLVMTCTYKDNPYFPQVLEKDRIADEKQLPRAEYEWIWGTACRNLGGIFFNIDELLVHGLPIEYPTLCDAVFAIIDTATKTGREHDGTAVTFFAANRSGAGIPLMILDWNIAKIEGASLEVWLPTVFDHLKYLTTLVNPRFGSLGAFIEDKNSGMVLLQHAKNKDWPAQAIDSKLTAMGKTERAITASPYVHRSMVKITKPAFDKTSHYNGVTANHQMLQIKSFKVGDEEKNKELDLLDTFCYGVALALGNSEGFG